MCTDPERSQGVCGALWSEAAALHQLRTVFGQTVEIVKGEVLADNHWRGLKYWGAAIVLGKVHAHGNLDILTLHRFHSHPGTFMGTP